MIYTVTLNPAIDYVMHPLTLDMGFTNRSSNEEIHCGGNGINVSTLLNELNGSDQATSGTVLVDGIDLYANYGMLKNAIGYVPQQDIVFDDLTLIDMLCYAAELRSIQFF